MKRLSLSLPFLWMILSPCPEARAYALSCTNAYNYTYFTEDAAVASKCKHNYDADCVWKNTAVHCKWQGSFKGTPKSNAGGAATPQAQLPSPQAQETYPLPGWISGGKEPMKASFETEEAAPPSAQVEAAEKLAEAEKKELEEAKREAKVSSSKVEELKLTLEEIRVNNQNNAILYRSPDASVGSAGPLFNPFTAKLSGEVASPEAGTGGGLLNAAYGGKKAMASGPNLRRDFRARGPASVQADISLGKTEETSALVAKESSAASDNPWVTYMNQTSKAGLVDRLRRNPKLRHSLRERIAELQSRGDQSGVVDFMEDALAMAEKVSQGPNFDDLKPMAFMEAFSMDPGETESLIRGLIADLDMPSDPQFLPQVSLFERVSVAHRRSLLRGAIHAKH